MSKLSPSSVKKDFGLKEGRLTLPPSAEYSSPGANYIAAASSLPLATSTPAQREMLQYKITWTEKVRNVFRFKKKKKGGFNTDPDVVHHPQPFSRAVGRGAKVHSTPKLFDPSMVSVENLARHSSSEDDIPESLLDDTLPVKASPGDHSNKQRQKEKVKKKDATKKAQQKQASMDEEDELSNIDSSVTEPHNNSAGQNSSYMAQSPSDLSKSSARERSSSSSDSSSSEDEEAATGYHMTSPITSNEWQEQIEKRRKKSVRSMDYVSHQKVDFERPLSAGNSTEVLNQYDDGFVKRKLTHNISDSVIVDKEYKRSKKRKPERVKGPHKSRENLGRPTILDVDMINQQLSFESEDGVDFSTMPQISRLSTKAAHDKCGVAKNIKRRKATTKRSLFLHTDEESKYKTSIVDPSSIAQSVKSSELKNAEQTVHYLQQQPQRLSSASIASKAAEQKRNSTEKYPVDSKEPSPELQRTDSKRKFSMSLLISKQILNSPLKTPVLPSPSPKLQRNEVNIFEQVKLKPINGSPIKTEQKSDTITSSAVTKVTKDKSNIPAVKEKPRRPVAPSQDKAQDLASPVKEHRTNIPKLTLDTDAKVDTREAAVSLPLKETRLPSINEHKRTKSRRAKTVAQPVKAIGYMKEAPLTNKPAWIEIAQQKTRRVSEALNSTDKLPQLTPSPVKQNSKGDIFFRQDSIPEGTGRETNTESSLPADGYVRRRLRTFSQDQTPKA